MGVPGFFSWLLRQYKNNKILLNDIDGEIKTFYIDANCLFHPQCFKILECCKDITDIEKLTKKMFARIANYISYIVSFTNPKEVFLSVDGVAPLAKMNQQRKRRYRSIDDNIIKNKIKEKYGKSSEIIWSNTSITPGTIFMERLHLYLMKYLKEFAKVNPHIKIIYSSYHSPGEGEHKILEHIRSCVGDNNKENIVIYGLDADLIFLAMSSGKDNIFLLREASQFGKSADVEIFDPVADVAEELTYVSIDQMKICYFDKIMCIFEARRLTQVEYQTDKSKIVNDFIFVCYLLGNDFLPHFPSIDIKRDGLNILLDAYVDVYMLLGINLISIEEDKNPDINLIFLSNMLRMLGNYELEYFKVVKPLFDRKMQRHSCPSTELYAVEIWNIENLKCFDIDDPIKLGNGNMNDWKFRYYEHYFKTSEYQVELIKQLCKNYLDGLYWVTYYYFKGCPS